jgi:hypothetical protein
MYNPQWTSYRAVLVAMAMLIGVLMTGCDQAAFDALLPSVEAGLRTIADGVISAAFVGLTDGAAGG